MKAKLVTVEHYLSMLLDKDYVPPRQVRFGGDVVIEYRKVPGAGSMIIRKIHSGRLRHGHEYEAMSLVSAARIKRCVHANVLNDSAEGTLSIEMKDHGLDLAAWADIAGFAPSSPLSSPTVLLALWREVIEALHEFHAAGMVHGDVKDDNICMPVRGKPVRLADGSIAVTWNLKKITLIDLGFSFPKKLTARSLWKDAEGRPYWVSGPHVSQNYVAVQHKAHERNDPTLLNSLDWRVDLFSAAWTVDNWNKRAGLKSYRPGTDSSETDAEAHRLLLALPRRLRTFDTDPLSYSAPKMPHQSIVDEIDQIIGKSRLQEISVRLRAPGAGPAVRGGSAPPDLQITESLLSDIAAKIGRAVHVKDDRGDTYATQTASDQTRSTFNNSAEGRSMPASTFDYVIDGSNTLLKLELDGVPSIRLFAALLRLLDSEKKTFKVWFDSSIYPILEKERGGDIALFKRLVAALNRRNVLQITDWADPMIQEDCKLHGAPVINGGDRNTSWKYLPPIIRCSISQSANRRGLPLFLYPAGGGEKFMQCDASLAFSFDGLEFSALSPTDLAAPTLVQRMAPDPVERFGRREGRKDSGNLLVLALDASNSMDSTDAHGGKTRHSLVTTAVRDFLSIGGFGKSRIASSTWVAVLSFAEDVRVVTPGAADGIFFPTKTWIDAVDQVNYLHGAKRGSTNLRLALDRAASFIEELVQRDKLEKKLAKEWQAKSVVMLTDGEHKVRLDSGKVEESDDIDDHVYRTVHRAPDIQFGFIGLGQGADNQALGRWASAASQRQMELAKTRDVPLHGGVLHVAVDPAAATAARAIRAFIDVASSTSKAS